MRTEQKNIVRTSQIHEDENKTSPEDEAIQQFMGMRTDQK